MVARLDKMRQAGHIQLTRCKNDFDSTLGDVGANLPHFLPTSLTP